MLYYDDGYVIDTSGWSKQAVDTDYLIKALNAGVSIQGVRLESNDLVFYDFRQANILKLKALNGCDINIFGSKIFITGSLGVLPLSLIHTGICTSLDITGDGTLILPPDIELGSFFAVVVDGNAKVDVSNLSIQKLDGIIPWDLGYETAVTLDDLTSPVCGHWLGVPLGVRLKHGLYSAINMFGISCQRSEVAQIRSILSPYSDGVEQFVKSFPILETPRVRRQLRINRIPVAQKASLECMFHDGRLYDINNALVVSKLLDKAKISSGSVIFNLMYWFSNSRYLQNYYSILMSDLARELDFY